jgi:hypothetical protein
MSGRWWMVGLCVALCAVAVTAQESSAQDESIKTLHVYTNLIQIPTLVLAGNRQPMQTPVVEKQFEVSVDSGPWFPVTHARLEGNDPISLSILLDTNAKELMPRMSESVTSLTSQLAVRDHVSIYALDCAVTRSLDDAPFDKRILGPAVEAVLKSWTARQEDHSKDCKRTVYLWDTIAFMVRQLSEVPGRRVIVVVTNGRDDGSKHGWNEVRAYAQLTGVAIFAVTNVPATGASPSGLVHYGSAQANYGVGDAHALLAMCELSGGNLLPVYPAMTEKRLQQIIEMVRGRYILEFPRPSNATGGAHDLQVKVAKGDDLFIRPSGNSVPLPDPSLAKDPTTVQAGPSQAPEQGNRRVPRTPK